MVTKADGTNFMVEYQLDTYYSCRTLSTSVFCLLYDTVRVIASESGPSLHIRIACWIDYMSSVIFAVAIQQAVIRTTEVPTQQKQFP